MTQELNANMTQPARSYAGFQKLKLFLALSRTPHGLLDMATPALGALLWLGRFPAFDVILIGLITTFAGYTAVYALNDVIDYRVDKEKLKLCGNTGVDCDLDAAMVRHPMAQGCLSLTEGMLWTVAWAVVAIWGAYHLNPVCILIFAMGCLLSVAQSYPFQDAGQRRRENSRRHCRYICRRPQAFAAVSFCAFFMVLFVGNRRAERSQ